MLSRIISRQRWSDLLPRSTSSSPFINHPLYTRQLATIMPIATLKSSVTAEVGGQHNVDRLSHISRDFRSMSQSAESLRTNG